MNNLYDKFVHKNTYMTNLYMIKLDDKFVYK